MLDCSPYKPGTLLFRPPQTTAQEPVRLAYLEARSGTPPQLVEPSQPSRVAHLAIWNHAVFDAAAECWEHGLDLVYSRGARIAAIMASVAHVPPSHTRNRAALYRRQRDPAWALACVREVVRAKIANQLALLRLYHDRPHQAWEDRQPHPVVWGDRYVKTLGHLRTALKQIDRVKGLAGLRGLEGYAARHYFSCWPMLTGHAVFLRTPRRPSDPINLLLDVCYARLAHRCCLHLLDHDLDVAAGMLHVDDTRPSLALDLMEPLRPLIVDRFVLRLLRRTPSDWIIPQGALYTLSTAGWRGLRQRWLAWLLGSASRPGHDDSIAEAIGQFLRSLHEATPIEWPRLR